MPALQRNLLERELAASDPWKRVWVFGGGRVVFPPCPLFSIIRREHSNFQTAGVDGCAEEASSESYDG